jgi:hypothetical protein
MPPQQAHDLLDLGNCLFGFRAHATILVLRPI